MPFPKVTVNLRAAMPRRGTSSPTGRTFLVTTDDVTAYGPVIVRSAAEATEAGASEVVASWVGDALSHGSPEVILVQAADYETALGLLTPEYGTGQVVAPAAEAGDHAILIAHAYTAKRTLLLDLVDPIAAAGLAAADGAEHVIAVGPNVLLPATTPGADPRSVPASVLAAGLIGHRDAEVGHANHAAAGVAWGVIPTGLGVEEAYTTTELDALAAAGVNVFRIVNKVPALASFYSVSDDDRWRQANWGRLATQIYYAFHDIGAPFLFQQIDGKGLLFADVEARLRGYLAALWDRGALRGEDAADAFDIEVRGVNTPATIAAGELHAEIRVWMTGHVEQVILNVSISTNQEA
jgi:phage tail sheath protein FI